MRGQEIYFIEWVHHKSSHFFFIIAFFFFIIFFFLFKYSDTRKYFRLFAKLKKSKSASTQCQILFCIIMMPVYRRRILLSSGHSLLLCLWGPAASFNNQKYDSIPVIKLYRNTNNVRCRVDHKLVFLIIIPRWPGYCFC